jgi:hypothetical protein
MNGGAAVVSSPVQVGKSTLIEPNPSLGVSPLKTLKQQ